MSIEKEFQCNLSKNKGCFIVIEGPDGAGKTLVSKNIVNILNDYDYNAIYVNNPGMRTKVSSSIRDIVLNNHLSDFEYALLFSAGIINNLNEIIIPALLNNKIVVCDRYIRSTYIYQYFYAKSNNESVMDYRRKRSLFDALQNYINHIKKPDYEFVLQIDPEVAISRIKERGLKDDQFETKDVIMITTLCEAYKNESLPRCDNSIHINANNNLWSVISCIMSNLGITIKEKGEREYIKTKKKIKSDDSNDKEHEQFTIEF